MPEAEDNTNFDSNDEEYKNSKEEYKKSNKRKNKKAKKNLVTVLIVLLIAAVAYGAYNFFTVRAKKKEESTVAYTQLIQDIEDGKVKKIEMTVGSTSITITYKTEKEIEDGYVMTSAEDEESEENEMSDEEKEKYVKHAIVPSNQAFVELIQEKIQDDNPSNDVFLIQNPQSTILKIIDTVFGMLPTIIMIVLVFMIIEMQGLGERGKVYDPDIDYDRVTLDDVAGLKEEKAEMKEIIDFLKNPKKYSAMGARVPKGVLLCGKPGTGKTLIAKAIAGEANVPFISMSGSEFVEMFAGLGASRVRKLFEKAEKISPCIIFIDEIDAIGSRRASQNGADTENNQTLNQLLVKMDGFDTDASIIVIAATNRPEMLDEALLRPGRFDRTITIGLPDVTDRELILKLHAKNKKVAEEVNFKSIAEDTAGFSGAELANIMNEAAIYAANRRHKGITNDDIEDAVKKVTVGLEKKDRVVSERDKKLTAYHEAGHAVVSRYLPTQNNVKEVSIIPRGVAGGYTMYRQNEDKWYVSKTEMEEKLISLMGGRAAEKIAMNDISTGASNDIEVAMGIARDMITVYGMNEKVGPMSINLDDRPYESLQLLGSDMENEIGQEVRKTLDKAYKQAQEMLIAHRDKLDIVAKLLLSKEKISEEEFNAIFKDEE